MKNVISLFILFIFASFGYTGSNLEDIWNQLKVKSEERQRAIITNQEFVQWYRENIYTQLSNHELKFLYIGLPNVVVDQATSTLTESALTGEWRSQLAETWGDDKDEVYHYWEERAVKWLISASRKECFLVTDLGYYRMKGSRLKNDVVIHDTPIIVTPFRWVIIYGKEVLQFPLDPVFKYIFQ